MNGFPLSAKARQELMERKLAHDLLEYALTVESIAEGLSVTQITISCDEMAQRIVSEIEQLPDVYGVSSPRSWS